MDKFAVCSAAQRMEYWRNIDPEPFAKVSKEQISDLQNVLLKIQDLLGDNNEDCIESAEIKEAANDVEDVFDTFVYNIRSVDRSVGIEKIGDSIFNIMSPDILSFKMESIRQRLQDVVVKLQGKANGVDQRRHIVSGYPAQEGRSVYEEDEYIVGLEGGIEKMVHQLTNRENEVENPPYLFFIVGGPSSGKTTLARQLYNNILVRQHFHNFIWFDQSRIFLRSLYRFECDIYEEVTRGFNVDMDDETWITDIGKCLIILDEIPCSLMEIVRDLLKAFPTRLNGTKIIITGSNEEYDIFKNDLRCYFHQVKGKINEEQGWDLLCHLTFDKQNTTIPEMLAKKMLRICEGQPISIKLLSGVLSTKGMVDNVKDIYELSYMNLGYNLKACFLYLGVFPCKYEIHAGVYRRMWMAEGFGGNSSEDEVMEYLEELSRRYLIHIVKRNLEGRIKIFQVSSLVYKFCITKAREENFLDTSSHQFGTSAINSRKVLFRSRWCIKTRDSYIRSLSLIQLQRMNDNRTRIGTSKHLKLLRVLNLQGVYTSDNTLPEEIGMLVHLSYLGIRNTNIEQLPKSIGNLTKLWTLDWREVYYAKYSGGRIIVPNVIWKMEQLQHIYIPKVMIRKNIFKLFTLNNLHTLWGMSVGHWLIDDAKMWNFPNLQKMYLFEIYLRDQLDTIFRSLIKSPNLRKLKLEWVGYSSKYNKLQNLHMDTLYKHCCQLSALILNGPIEANVALRFPPNLVVLELVKSKIQGHDPFLLIGNCCPKLKVLKLKHNAYRGTEMRCNAGAYPCLTELVVHSMYELETWVIETGALPRLEKLLLYNTCKLSRLPEGLRFITTLRELILESMPKSFCEKLVHVEQDYLTTVADKLKGNDFYIIQHVAAIRFFNIIDEQKENRFNARFAALETRQELSNDFLSIQF